MIMLRSLRRLLLLLLLLLSYFNVADIRADSLRTAESNQHSYIQIDWLESDQKSACLKVK